MEVCKITDSHSESVIRTFPLQDVIKYIISRCILDFNTEEQDYEHQDNTRQHSKDMKTYIQDRRYKQDSSLGILSRLGYRTMHFQFNVLEFYGVFLT